MPRPIRFWGGGWGMLIGTLDITNYNATTTEETGITKFFKPFHIGATSHKVFILCQSTSSNGYTMDAITTTGKFKAWQESGSDTGARTEAATDTNVGTLEFIAIGVVN